jgi:ubiquinone/menaquinone biosynthesis C-methylase UbiE
LEEESKGQTTDELHLEATIGDVNQSVSFFASTRAMEDSVKRQREYYAAAASDYDGRHFRIDDPHNKAVAFLRASIELFQYESVLDVGSGTGRAVVQLRSAYPSMRIIGIEPVEALRKIGHEKGVPEDCLIDGDAVNLDFPDNKFDVVCAFGILHHIPNPERALSEMLRVARKAIYISDANRFAQGSWLAKRIKRSFWKLGLWPFINWIKTKGTGYTFTEGDGVSYSYSIYDNFALIKRHCTVIHLLNLTGDGIDPLYGSTNIALLGMKDR